MRIDLTTPCTEPDVINESVRLRSKQITTEVDEVGVLRGQGFHCMSRIYYAGPNVLLRLNGVPLSRFEQREGCGDPERIPPLQTNEK